uniref:HMG box domain-containing protein n=1 Tax=Rhizophagus irregularis (strain DAOM 181602 / DAOM 197198 / MUCL 43194) TaxID=747089 RepID=U9UH46_RHIID
MSDDITERVNEDNDTQVEKIISEINIHELFHVGNVKKVIESKNRNPSEEIGSWKLFNKVFKDVCPNYDNIEPMIISRVKTKIWESASANQKSIYATYSQNHNEEIRKIFPGIWRAEKNG